MGPFFQVELAKVGSARLFDLFLFFVFAVYVKVGVQIHVVIVSYLDVDVVLFWLFVLDCVEGDGLVFFQIHDCHVLVTFLGVVIPPGDLELVRPNIEGIGSELLFFVFRYVVGVFQV